MKTAQKCNCFKGIELVMKTHLEHLRQPLTATEHTKRWVQCDHGCNHLASSDCTCDCHKPTEKCCERCIGKVHPLYVNQWCPCHRKEEKCKTHYNEQCCDGINYTPVPPKAEEKCDCHGIVVCPKHSANYPSVKAPTLKEIEELEEDPDIISYGIHGLVLKLNEVIKAVNELRR